RVVVPVHEKPADERRAARCRLLAIRWDRRNLAHASRRRDAFRGRKRLLKSAPSAEPRALREPNDWLSRQRLRVQLGNVRREQQAQAERQADRGRDDTDGDGGAADALPSPSRSVDENGGTVRHREKRMIREAPADRGLRNSG